MSYKTRSIVHAGLIGSLYIVLTYAQNLIWPDSTSMAIQFRVSEVLCVLAFFTPAAIPGLTLGCLIFNLSWAQSLPLDFLVGSLATFLGGMCMRRLRRAKWGGIPWPGLCMPAVFNALLVGWELTAFLAPGGFSWAVFGLNALCVFIGEAGVLLTCGAVLYRVMARHRIAEKIFGSDGLSD